MPAIPRSQLAAMASIALARARLRISGLRYRVRPGDQIPAEQLSRLSVQWSMLSAIMFVAPVRGRAIQMTFTRDALRSGAAAYIARALVLELGFLAIGGARHGERVRALHDEAVEVAGRVDDAAVLGTIHTSSGVASCLLGLRTLLSERRTFSERYLSLPRAAGR